MDDWYKRLNNYFPEDEMKEQQHMEKLLNEKPYYHKEVTQDYILVYGEYEEFIFIDYLLVDGKKRGKGIGSKVLKSITDKGKVILLEVEPIDAAENETAARQQFYLKNDFKIAKNVEYYRGKEEEPIKMELFYWNNGKEVSDEQIRKYALKTFHDIHYYGMNIDNMPEAKDMVRITK